MKNLILSTIVVLCSVMLTSSCKKDKTGIDGLPPLTQTGAQTFGCLIDGTLFIPKGSGIGSPIKESVYTIANRTPLFTMVATDRSSSSRAFSLRIRTEGIELKTGMIIPLVNEGVGRASVIYYDDQVSVSEKYITDEINKGELEITRFDLTNKIISGKFWFNAVNINGKVVKATEGKFDMNF